MRARWARLRPRTRWRVTAYAVVPVLVVFGVLCAVLGLWPSAVTNFAVAVVFVMSASAQASAYRAGFSWGAETLAKLLQTEQQHEADQLLAELNDPHPWDHR